ncbi:isochorismatase family protein [Patulibacter minatonensis]|uniref:isochorismatase family protein n=1 Tax=Patulibacter minatonensis TaxID=298163 RepID=UPI00047E1694|nr:isochorismatase family protein [Patulibacter minatonensis]
MTRPKSPWSDVITEDDERRYEAAGFGRPSGFGKRPALVIIDVQHRTIGNSPKPFFASLEDYTTSCGDVGWAAVEQIAKLLAVFREFDLPVLYPHVAPKTDADRSGVLGAKVPGIMDVPDHGYRFPDAVAPRPGDLLLPKKHPSAFFATPLASYLIGLGADTIVTTGATTSGCVRGTVVDGFSYNFKCVVPHDAVYDRSPTVHQANLFDLGQKYADVSSTDEVVAQVREIGEAAR